MDSADSPGPFFLGANISFVDVQVAPWFLRMRRVLKPYRGWPEPIEGSRLASWVDALEGNEAVKATTSGDELYLDSYERYAGKCFYIFDYVFFEGLSFLPSLSFFHPPLDIKTNKINADRNHPPHLPIQKTDPTQAKLPTQSTQADLYPEPIV